MFRAEGVKPTHYEEGFFDFFDKQLLPRVKKLQYESRGTTRLVAHHVIPPGLAPSDQEAFRRVKNHEMASALVVGIDYRRRIAAASLLGCATTRLQIVPGNRPKVPLSKKFIRWQRDISLQVHEEAGEGAQVAWWGDQEESMTAALVDGSGPVLVDEFIQGVGEDFPVGGHWTLYGDGEMEEPLIVAGVMYRRDKDGVKFEGFNAYDASQLTPETLRYIRFWRDVHRSQQDSLVLHESYALG